MRSGEEMGTAADFKPFRDENATMVGGITFEGSSTGVVVHGAEIITPNEAGIASIEAMRRILDRIEEAVRAGEFDPTPRSMPLRPIVRD